MREWRQGSVLVLVLVGIVIGGGSLYGQTVTLDCGKDGGDCHVVPIAGGSGGLVGRAKPGVDKVDAFLVCRGADGTKVVQRELVPESGGLVSALFGFDDGSNETLVCGADEDAELELRGLTDGGWYWLHDELNTAVAPMMAKDVLGNRKITPVNPGSPDIVIQPNKAGTASFLTDRTSGRVGILPHVLPVPDEDIAACGPEEDGEEMDGTTKYKARETNCLLGDGGTVVAVHTVEGTGRAPVRGARVVRPVSGTKELTVSLWLNGTGSVVYGDSDEYAPTFGWLGIEDEDGAAPLAVADWNVSLPEAGPEAVLAAAGIVLGDADSASAYRTLTVSASADYCPAVGRLTDLKVRVRAASTSDTDGTALNPVRPPIRHSDDLDGAAAETLFDLVCPPRSASAASAEAATGRELTVSSGLDGR